MNNSFTFEAEPFEYESSGGQPPTGVYEQEAWETGSPYAEEFEFEGEAPVISGQRNAPPQAACPGYLRGEVEKSFTNQGHLAADVIHHARGLLLADFGVNWRTPRASFKSDATLREWLATTAQVIQANPTTTLRILGFSDCVGNERNNRHLRHGRAVRVLALLNQMAGAGPQWTGIKSSIKLVDAAPAGDYVASNATVEGRAQNRGVLIESNRTIDFEPQVIKACKITPRQALTYALLRVIPNDPDYQKFIPLNYKLNAKKIVGGVAQDVSTNGKKAHFWIDLVHWGIVGAEILAEGSLLVAGLTIAGPVLALVGNFLALGIPCVEAAQIVADKWSATGFARGVVMGADQRKAQQLKDYFGNDYFPPNHFCPQARDVAIANYKMGLLVGFVQGRLLCPNQRTIFFRDLGRRMGDQSYRGDSKRWGRREWVDWYVSAAAAFKGHHLE
jgi:outer membrane protein OmpA-like peptidoglycan-associated protein